MVSCVDSRLSVSEPAANSFHKRCYDHSSRSTQRTPLDIFYNRKRHYFWGWAHQRVSATLWIQVIFLSPKLYFLLLLSIPKIHRIPGLPGGAVCKESSCQCRRCQKSRSNSWVSKIPWSMKWQLTPVFLPEEFHGQRRLASFSPWGRK